MHSHTCLHPCRLPAPFKDGNEHEETFVNILLMNVCGRGKVKGSNFAVLVTQPHREAENDAAKELIIFIGLDC